MSLRQNKTLMIGGGICAVILIAEAAMLGWGAYQLSGANGMLAREQRKLGRLQERDPYPSLANVQTLEKNLDELEYRVGELAAEMNRDPFPQEAVEPAEFSARAQDVIERFRKRAVRAGMVLPATLEIGFAQYASGGVVPRTAHVPRLTRQLYSVERVADVLVQSGVTSVESMSRDLFENAAQADHRRRPRNAPVSNVRKPLPLVASDAGPGGLFFVERIGVSFTAKEDVVWRVLDGYSAAPHFMVVSEFTHQTKSSILSYNPEAVKKGADGDDDTLRYLAEGILSGEKALSRPERIIAGNELVEVRLTIDVFNFKPEGAAR